MIFSHMDKRGTLFVARRAFVNKRKSESASFGATWTMFSLMYLMTSDTVEPFGKLEFFWRFLAGPLNSLPI